MNKKFPSSLGLAFLFSTMCLVALITLVTKQSSTVSAQPIATDGNVLESDALSDIQNAAIANCRYGTAPVWDDGYLQSQAIPQLGAGWYLNFGPGWNHPYPANDAEYVHMIKTHQQKTAEGEYLEAYYTSPKLGDYLISIIKENPGELWIIGNEIERGPNPGEIEGGQGDIHAEIYAEAYHEVRAFIRQHDPTARIAISALVEVTPNRLQYLDKVWNAYLDKYGQPMPVDVWNMHVYVLPEVEADGITPNGIANIALGIDPTSGKRGSDGRWQVCDDPDVYCLAEHDDMDVFGEQVMAMRQWMKKHGQQQKPLILSEFSILYPYIDEGASCYIQDEYGNCFKPDRVSTFMTNSFTYLNQLRNGDLGYAVDNDRLVQQWLWFALYSSRIGNVSNLLQADKQTLSQVGQTFRQMVYAEPTVVNLVLENIPRLVIPVDQSGTAIAPLRVAFRNNGNTAVEEPFTVTFYADEARKQEIGSVLVDEGVRGCTTAASSATVQWPGLAPGEYRYWVTVDSGNVIAEGPPQQQDNHGSGLVTVNARSGFVPLLIR